MLVGQRHHRAGDGGVGVGHRPTPARPVVGDAPARHLFEQQLRDMAAAVVAQVNDEAVAVALGAEVAVELGVAGRHHVGQVEVADAPAAALVDPGAPRLDPLAVARRRLVGDGGDEHAARAGRTGQRQLDLLARLMHQQHARRHRARHRLAADGDDALADLGFDARRAQRRVGAGVPGVAFDQAHDLPAGFVADMAKLGAQVAQPDRGRLAVVAAHLVGVRGAEFALQLPDQVRQLAARRHTIGQWRVLRPHAGPVDAGQLGVPELVALQPPGLAQHLPPFGTRLDRHADAVEVDPAALARGFVAGVLVVGARLAVDRDGAQLLALAHQQRRVVGGQREGVDLLHQRLGAAAREVEALEPARRFLVAAAAMRADDRQRCPDHPGARRAGELAETPFGHRKGRDALRDAVEVDAHRCRRGLVGRRLLGL